jgi:hypothetical protein
VLHAGGVLGPNALVSGQLADWGLPGPGRYVTVYANAGHVFMYVAALRFDTSYNGTDTGPNAGHSGPRSSDRPCARQLANEDFAH